MHVCIFFSILNIINHNNGIEKSTNAMNQKWKMKSTKIQQKVDQIPTHDANDVYNYKTSTTKWETNYVALIYGNADSWNGKIGISWNN